MKSKDNPNSRLEIERLQDSLGFIINGLGRLMRNTLDAKLHGTNFNPTFWTVLMALGEEDHLNQTDLCRRTILDGATMTRALDALEAQNYIERNRVAEDRRVQIVTLTREGRRVYREYAPLGAEVNNEVAAAWTPRQRQQLEEWIWKAINHVQELNNGEMHSGR